MINHVVSRDEACLRTAQSTSEQTWFTILSMNSAQDYRSPIMAVNIIFSEQSLTQNANNKRIFISKPIFKGIVHQF